MMKCGHCQSKEGLSKRQIVVWDGVDELVQVCNVEKTSIYLLLTNLIQVSISEPKHQEMICPQCEKKMPGMSYKVQINARNRESEQSYFKYCILVLESSTGAYKKTIGTNQSQLYLKGNLVAKHLMMQSQKKLKESQCYSTILSEQKTSNLSSTWKKQPISAINPYDELQSFKFQLRQSLPVMQKYKLYDIYEADIKEQTQSFKTLSKCQSSASVNNPLKPQENSKLVEIKQYKLYIIKMQKEIQNLYRNQMLHEYVWQQEQTHFIMQQVSLFYGQFQSIQQKRRYLRFTFKKESTNTDFEVKWNNLSRQILLRKDKIVQGKIINYYIFSKQQILPNSYLTNKLFLLPYTSPIIDLCLADPWVAVAATNYVLFIHAYQPMEYFQHQSKIEPIKISTHKQNSTLLVILHKEGISCYKLLDKTIILQSVSYTSFLEPHGIQYLGDSIILAGIDLQQKQSKRTVSTKRMVYKIQDKFKKVESDTVNNSAIKAELQKQYHILTVSGDKKHIPIQNLVVVPNKEVFACAFLNAFILFSKHGQKIIEVQLKSNIRKAFFLPFMFNLFNFLVVTQNNQGVRIGVESYGGTLGAELQKLKLQNVRDAGLSYQQNKKYELLVVANDIILTANYLKEQNEEIIREQKGKTIFLSSDNMGIVYLIDLQHSFELKYLEI